MKPESGAPATVTPGQQLDNEAVIAAARSLDKLDQRNNIYRKVTGALFIGAAALTSYSLVSHEAERLNFEFSMPYLANVQKEVNHVDNWLEDVGEIAFISALGATGAIRMGARRKTNEHLVSTASTLSEKLAVVDEESSQELTSETNSTNPTVARRALRRLAAGKVPVLASIAVGLASFSTAVGTEVSNGPTRPIEKVVTDLAPGQSMITNDKGDQPMLDSSLPLPLAKRIESDAHAVGASAYIFDRYLDYYQYGKKSGTALTLGVQTPLGSPLSWNTNNCNTVPIEVDQAAHIPVGSTVLLNGQVEKVIGEIKGTSAIGRIGIVEDDNALRACVMQSPEHGVSSIIINAPIAQTESILKQANTQENNATVISTEEFIHNSQKFWEGNVLPITNTLSLVSGVFALAAMSGSILSRLLRNRRQLATAKASGLSDAWLRTIELTRSAKEGVLATVIGSAGSLATPVIVNSLEPGFNAAVGLKSIAVGAAIGIIGTVGGAATRLIRPERTINTAKNTRAQ